MIALQITSMKMFMSQLLTGTAFDSFRLEEAVISTINTFTIDGHINKEFLKDNDAESVSVTDSVNAADNEFRPWSEIKGLCFDLIKGKRTPIYFSFVLHLDPAKADALLAKDAPDIDRSQVKALLLNIRFTGGKITLTTGCSYRTFLLSKDADIAWDKALTRYLALKEIPFEEL